MWNKYKIGIIYIDFSKIQYEHKDLHDLVEEKIGKCDSLFCSFKAKITIPFGFITNSIILIGKTNDEKNKLN
jgi:hypothetical protein